MATAAEQARDEAYASAPVDQIVHHVVELDHPSFDAPLFFMAGVEEDVAIRLEDGQAATAIACAFDLTPPGFEDSGPTPANLQIDGVSFKLFPVLKRAVGGGVVKVTYRAYLGDDFGTPVDLIEGLELKKVTLSAASAQGELTFREIATQAFPRQTYDLETYPGLWNS
ncbi:DUF1833 domain-containing protein [Methylobacterium organophilum]|uniref:DUF1833 family protein n=1 Tax=Methylobacterium organophilum TaxID=410 RepID=UPI001F1450F9|nr:DUF1833 family protein [Methylobacterium organophilum]UMY16667.1 DUF1833 domain-containing protein [Methylobacterium organophilum]